IAWAQQQQNLTAEDSNCKYKKTDECSTESQSQDTDTTETNEVQNQTVTNTTDESSPVQQMEF
ncbi:MAG: hypothetical protein IJQ55_00085, partial [Alphaproteobacteria bacterium]|nr:hypothetical protein [Alphaproteobacteria bacterium]